MRFMDFTSLHGVVISLLGLAIFTLIGMGIRVLMMLTLQQRQQRANRQINERLRALIAAYKVLGGSFTGELLVDPSHLRALRQQAPETTARPPERARRIRDAVEAALSDIILLGTEDQVRMAARAATNMAAGHPIRTDALVISLRDYIRRALDLDPVPQDVTIPAQGPARQLGGSAKSGRDKEGGSGGGGLGGMGGAMGGGGMGLGLGIGHLDDEAP